MNVELKPSRLPPQVRIRRTRVDPLRDVAAHIFGWGRGGIGLAAAFVGFRPTAWYTDRVTVSPLGGRPGAVATRLLEPLEAVLLPRLLPLFSSSLIVACNPDKPN